ncbi:MAG: hypothetical protein WC333_06145 [Dehalococcoidia bacterium]|jgi:uncharacterized membrane protein
MANDYEGSAYPRGYKKKIAGIIASVIGILGIILCTIIFIKAEGVLPSVDAFTGLFTGVLGIPISALILLIGAILFFVGRSQEKKQRALDAHESQSESK